LVSKTLCLFELQFALAPQIESESPAERLLSALVFYELKNNDGDAVSLHSSIQHVG
jgi:hypothetical protein